MVLLIETKNRAHDILYRAADPDELNLFFSWTCTKQGTKGPPISSFFSCQTEGKMLVSKLDTYDGKRSPLRSFTHVLNLMLI